MTDDTKNRLLEAAGETFAARGYESATVREICERAGANLASVNYYFGDKQRLYIDAVRQAQCVCVEQVPTPEWDPDLPPVERLRTYIHTMLSRMLYVERPAWHLGLMLRELANPTGACVAVVDDYIRPMAEELERILVDLLPDGTPRPQAYLTGFSIVGQCLFYYVHRPIAEQLIGVDEYRQLSIDRLADHIARFSLAALGYGQPLATPTGKG
ncbi:MAG TPA: CerR family C-terminal domain-containing protein [Pirellulales bacterium]|jgi:AcrR family transcriptional regulator